MKEQLFKYSKVSGGWEASRNGERLGVVLSIPPVKGHPWAKYLPAGDASAFGNWYERRDDAAFELLMRHQRKSPNADISHAAIKETHENE